MSFERMEAIQRQYQEDLFEIAVQLGIISAEQKQQMLDADLGQIRFVGGKIVDKKVQGQRAPAFNMGTQVEHLGRIYEVSGIGGSPPERLDCSFRYIGPATENQ